MTDDRKQISLKAKQDTEMVALMTTGLKSTQINEALARESTPKGQRAKAVAMKEEAAGGLNAELSLMLSQELG